MDKKSYALGMNVGINLLQSGVTKVTYSDFNRGMKHIIGGMKTELTEDEMTKLLGEYFKECAEEARNQIRKRNTDWLNDNAFRNGTTTYPSGLQVRMITQGSDDHPSGDSRVTCNYEARLIDGKVIDSTYTKGSPAVIDLSKAVKGFSEGVRNMGVGGKAEIAVPYNLAYGENGLGNVVPPYSTIIYRIELLSIN